MDPAQLYDVLKDVLLQHMNDPRALAEYRVQRAILIGKNSGRMISEDDISSGHDVPGGLQLMMQSGAEFLLTITPV